MSAVEGISVFIYFALDAVQRKLVESHEVFLIFAPPSYAAFRKSSGIANLSHVGPGIARISPPVSKLNCERPNLCLLQIIAGM